MIWFRIDNRLVHGQVIEGWLPYLNARALVVLNDALAKDELQQRIMQLAIPNRIRLSFIPVSQGKARYDELAKDGFPSLFLLANCQDVMRIVEQGVPIPLLNVGNMHYAKGKRQLCAHVAVSEDDLECFDFLKEKGIRLDFRCVPGDGTAVEGW